MDSFAEFSNANERHKDLLLNRFWRSRLKPNADILSPESGAGKDEVRPGLMLAMSCVALLFDFTILIAIFLLLPNHPTPGLSSASRNLNVDSALVHFWADVFRGVLLCLGSVVMLATDLQPWAQMVIDGCISLGIALVLVLVTAWMIGKVVRKYSVSGSSPQASPHDGEEITTGVNQASVSVNGEEQARDSQGRRIFDIDGAADTAGRRTGRVQERIVNIHPGESIVLQSTDAGGKSTNGYGVFYGATTSGKT